MGDSSRVTALILPQVGIFAQGTHAHYFLEFDLHGGVLPKDVTKSFLRLRSPEVSAGGVNFVVAFGSKLWRELSPTSVPESLTDFQEVVGPDGHKAPATQHDAWVWISGNETDTVWDHARASVQAVSDVAAMVAEQAGFTYHDSRDETGFVDGTANPELLRAPTVAIVPAGQPGEGGSHVLAMRWVHDLTAFNKLPMNEQQFVFGRTKPDSIEIPDAERPASAHISRVQVRVEGKELEIFRRSVPYGSVSEYGLYFVAFSADPSRYGRMLASMFGIEGDGTRDRLLDFSRPVSGAYYFAPSLNALSELAGPKSS